MQKVSLRKVKAPVSYLQENSEEVLHFSLQGLLPAGHTLALNTTLGTLSHQVCKDDRPYMMMEQQFTTSEICVLLPLMEAYPYYCPYEVLLSYIISHTVTVSTVDSCRRLLEEARRNRTSQQELRPVRRAISSLRNKLLDFHLGVSNIRERGCSLTGLYISENHSGESSSPHIL